MDFSNKNPPISSSESELQHQNAQSGPRMWARLIHFGRIFALASSKLASNLVLWACLRPNPGPARVWPGLGA